MATITISDSTYQRLTKRASDQSTTVDELVKPLIDRFADELVTDQRDPAQWKTKLDVLLTLANSVSHRYPPGFEVDVSCEAMYPSDSPTC